MGAVENKEPQRVRRMFDGIARRYDLLNHILSLNLDRRWRRAAALEIPTGDDLSILDLCGGTGDLTLELAHGHRSAHVVCCDFSHEMLVRAQPKFEKRGFAETCVCLEADGLRLPFPDATFDAVTVAFGVRNFVDMDAGLREIHRVITPGGRLVILEFSRPTKGWLKPVYGAYLRHLLPRFGDRVAGRSGPYAYLARTIASFPDAPELAGRVRQAGFAACGWAEQSGGIVAIHTAFKG